MIPGTIGVPCGALVSARFVLGFHELAKPNETAFLMLSGEGVAFQRNAIAEHCQGDWLLFVDDDMIPEPDALLKLLARGEDKDIIHAVCCQRVPPYRYCTWGVDGTRFEPPLGTEMVEAGGCGMAFTLIRRRVFEAMPKPWFEVGKGADPTAIYEDMWFCVKARRLGFRIWADPTVRIWHLTQHAVAPGMDGRPHVIAAGDTLPQMRQEDDDAGHVSTRGSGTPVGSGSDAGDATLTIRNGQRTERIPA